MAPFTVNTRRIDPYKTFKFRLKWDGRQVAGVSKVSTLKRSTEAVKYRLGDAPPHSRKLPGRTRYDVITLERGITQDEAFHAWASAQAADVRHDLSLEVCNEAGQVAITYTLLRCRVSAFQAVPDLGSNANTVAFDTLKLEIQRLLRDGEPTEPLSLG